MFHQSRMIWALTALYYPVEHVSSDAIKAFSSEYKKKGDNPKEAAVRFYFTTFNTMDSRGNFFQYQDVTEATKQVLLWGENGDIKPQFASLFVEQMQNNISSKYE